VGRLDDVVQLGEPLAELRGHLFKQRVALGPREPWSTMMMPVRMSVDVRVNGFVKQRWTPIT
jgi:hypothetical protein